MVGEKQEKISIVLDKDFNANTSTLGRKDLYLDCNCQGEIVRLSKWDDEEEIYLTVYQYLSQRYSLWERIKILVGGKVKTCDIILSKENFNKIKKWNQ